MEAPLTAQNATPTGNFILTIAMLEKMEELLLSYIDTPQSARGQWFDKNWSLVWLTKRPHWNFALGKPSMVEDAEYHNTKRVRNQHRTYSLSTHLLHRLSSNGFIQMANSIKFESFCVRISSGTCALCT